MSGAGIGKKGAMPDPLSLYCPYFSIVVVALENFISFLYQDRMV